MNLLEEKLNLFKKILKEVKEENSMLDNQQYASEATIKRIGNILAKALNKEIPNEIEEKDIKSKLGIIDFGVLKTLSNKSISGLKVNPLNVKGDQKAGASSTDVKVYEKVQVVPFLALNKDGKTLSGSKGEEDFYILFWLPAIGIPILKSNINLHSELFGLDKPEEGFTYKHIAIKNIPNFKITKDQVSELQINLRNAKLSGFKEMIRDNKGGKRKSTSRD